MEALDRYLKAVRPFLPKRQRDQILRELSEHLRAEIKQKEAEFGRALDDADQEAILDAYGSPFSVAGQYWAKGPRLALGVELIGRELFPFYVKALAVPVGITLALFAILAARGGARLTEALFPIAVQLTVVTLIVIAVQLAQRKYGILDRWKPRSQAGPEMLRRYLHALRFWLPPAQQDDIVAEVGDDLRSRIEDREAELGRKLNGSEVAAILKQRGQPMLVAAGYLPQRYLVGPAYYPAFLFVVKLVVLWILVPCYLVIVGPMAARSAVNPALAWAGTLWGLAMASVFGVGAVTVAFAAIQRFPHRLSEWDPQRLPAVPPAWDGSAQRVSPYVAAAEVVMSVIVVGFWVYIMRYHPTLDLGDVRIAPAPIFEALFWPILVTLLAGTATGTASLLAPSRPRIRSGIRLAINGLTLVVTAILLSAPSWVQVTALGVPSKGIEDAAKGINLGVWITLAVMVIAVAVDAFQETRRMFNKRMPGATAWSRG